MTTCTYCKSKWLGDFQYKNYFECGTTFAELSDVWRQSKACQISQMEQRIALLERQVAAIIERNTLGY